MLPLIDGAGYKLFDTKMLSLTDGARDKLFGMKMSPHLPREGEAFLSDAAYLVQNAFPITADYLDHIHTLQGVPLTLHTTTATTIINCLNNNLLHKRGIRLFFADIDRLFHLMADHLNEIAVK